MLERWLLVILPSLLIVAFRPFAWPMLLILLVAPMLLLSAGACLLRNRSSVSWALTVFAMLTTAVVFGKFGWWSIDDDDEYRGLLPLLIMSLIPWWGVRPKSLPRAILPPSLLVLASGLLAFAFWGGEKMPVWSQHILCGLIQALAIAALLLHIDWWHEPPQSGRGFVALLVLNVLTSLFVGFSEMGDRPVFRYHGTQPNVFLAVLFVLVVPGILCWRYAESGARGKGVDVPR